MAQTVGKLGAHPAVSAIALLVASGPALAQQAPVPAQTAEAGLAEVVVTAEKHEEKLVDTPLSVSVVGADDIKRERVEEIDDLAGKLPNVDIKEYIPGSDPVITVRGIGLNDFSVTGNPSAGVYKDEVYLPTNAMLNLDLYDLARLEVLKGPQGTLYGRNSTAGAINIVSAAPTDKLEGFASLGYSSYETVEGEAWLNVPVSDQFQMRFSGKFIDASEGYWTNTTVGGSDNLGKRAVLEGRAQASWEPDSTTDINLKLEEFHTDSQLGQPQFFGTVNPAARVFPIAAYYQLKPGEVAIPLSVIHAANPAIPALPGIYYVPGEVNPKTGQPLPGVMDFAVLGGLLANPASVTCGAILKNQISNGCSDALGYTNASSDPFTGAWPANPPLQTEQQDVTLTIHHDFDGVTLTSITGFIDFDRTFETDTNAGPYPEFIFTERTKIDQESQEFRLNGGSGDPLSWIVGAFYSHDHVDDRDTGDLSDFFFTKTLTSADQSTDVAAVFANGDWRIDDRLKLTTGLRYSWEQRRYDGGTTDLDPYGTSILVDLLNPACIGHGACPLTHIDQTITDRNVSFRVALDYKIDEHSILYGSISRSTKSGGFFDGITTANFQLEPYKPEQLTAYEIGYKLGAPNLFLAPAFFYYDYDDVQVFAPDRDPTTGVSAQRVINVPSATVYGADLEANWLPAQGLRLGLGVGIMHAELGAFTIASGPVPAGNQMPNAPKVTVNGLVRYEHPVTDAWMGSIQATVSYESRTYKEALDTPYLAADAHTVLDARIGLDGTDNPYQIAVWGKNLTDTRYVSEAQNLGLGSGYRFYNTPRTVGVTLAYKF